MDLYAHSQIDDLEHIAKENGIEVPRLRGYRLMKDEEKVSQEEIERLKKECEVDVLRSLIGARPFWSLHPDYEIGDDETDRLERYYLIENPDSEDYYDRWSGIRWDRIHGKKRKILKYALKRQKKCIQDQMDMFNKYVGREDVLYIHSRMGGGNWEYFNGKAELMHQPWFLDRVDDHFDNTYCDFYAKIKVGK